ncbi:hypothetical protein LOK49_LG03G00219 [Camellia lanceoleosa]|uniref:Uncharacterized protein n=1 Tax=Camellia lanceoleosa TaxID=1840588 RepID=A0ACC0IB17_9ERIC|nr:hypothetical protein LOK49_LG03G00219 [Camellia lanceoleosa]
MILSILVEINRTTMRTHTIRIWHMQHTQTICIWHMRRTHTIRIWHMRHRQAICICICICIQDINICNFSLYDPKQAYVAWEFEEWQNVALAFYTCHLFILSYSKHCRFAVEIGKSG